MQVLFIHLIHGIHKARHFSTKLNATETICTVYSSPLASLANISLLFLFYLSQGPPCVCNPVRALMGPSVQLQTESHPILAMEIRSMGKIQARRWAKHCWGPVTQEPLLHRGSIQAPLNAHPSHTPKTPPPLPPPHPIACFLNAGEWKLRFNDCWKREEGIRSTVWDVMIVALITSCVMALKFITILCTTWFIQSKKT